MTSLGMNACARTIYIVSIAANSTKFFIDSFLCREISFSFIFLLGPLRRVFIFLIFSCRGERLLLRETSFSFLAGLIGDKFCFLSFLLGRRLFLGERFLFLFFSCWALWGGISFPLLFLLGRRLCISKPLCVRERERERDRSRAK